MLFLAAAASRPCTLPQCPSPQRRIKTCWKTRCDAREPLHILAPRRFAPWHFPASSSPMTQHTGHLNQSVHMCSPWLGSWAGLPGFVFKRKVACADAQEKELMQTVTRGTSKESSQCGQAAVCLRDRSASTSTGSSYRNCTLKWGETVFAQISMQRARVPWCLARI